jgi:HemY protein
MIRVLLAIAFVFAAVLALDALGSVPVQVAISWPGHEMLPPLRIVVVGLLVFAALAVLLWSIVSFIVRGPTALRGFFRGRRRDRGYAALSRGMIAIGSGDTRLAHRYADDARRLLPAEPLVLLLEAQTAQMEGRADEARAVFTRMLDAPDTRLLGLRGLFIEANRAGEAEAARQYAAEAQRLSPGLPWAGTAVIENQSADHDWAGALATLDQNAAARLVDKADAKRLRAVLLTARAIEVEDPDPTAARNYALEATRIAPGFVPAAVVASRVLTRLQDTRKAAKVIETAWKENPHPELADAYIHVRPGDSGFDRLKRARTLQAIRPNEIEGVLAVARAALDAGEFKLARETLSKALRQSTTQRVCLLMADLEEAETGDPGRVREWLGRAVRAPRDAAWTADGVVSETWHPVSPVTGRLDAFEWRVPVNVESGATELDGSDLAERAARPIPPPPVAVPPPATAVTVVDQPRAAEGGAPERPARPDPAPRAEAPFVPEAVGQGLSQAPARPAGEAASTGRTATVVERQPDARRPEPVMTPIRPNGGAAPALAEAGALGIVRRHEPAPATDAGVSTVDRTPRASTPMPEPVEAAVTEQPKPASAPGGTRLALTEPVDPVGPGPKPAAGPASGIMRIMAGPVEPDQSAPVRTTSLAPPPPRAGGPAPEPAPEPIPVATPVSILPAAPRARTTSLAPDPWRDESAGAVESEGPAPVIDRATAPPAATVAAYR